VNSEQLLHQDIDRYLTDLIPARPPVIQRMEQYGRERNFPFIGPLVGEMLFLLTRAINARRVLELGSGFGFSAMHFALAMPADGKIICTDGDAENKKMAIQFFKEAGISEKLEYHVGDAVSIMEKLEGEFDIILMDIDKEGYPEGFRKGWPRLRKGGFFIADNLLWDGRVIKDDDSASTRGVREFTKLIYGTAGAKTTIIPLRDGVSVTMKLAGATH